MDTHPRERGHGGAQPRRRAARTRARGPPALGYNALEAEELLRGLDGESPEELIAGALRTTRAA